MRFWEKRVVKIKQVKRKKMLFGNGEGVDGGDGYEFVQVVILNNGPRGRRSSKAGFNSIP